MKISGAATASKMIVFGGDELSAVLREVAEWVEENNEPIANYIVERGSEPGAYNWYVIVFYGFTF